MGWGGMWVGRSGTWVGWGGMGVVVWMGMFLDVVGKVCRGCVVSGMMYEKWDRWGEFQGMSRVRMLVLLGKWV